MHFKNLEGKLERESSIKTIFSNGGFVRLQMVSEPDTKLWTLGDMSVKGRWIPSDV